MMSKTSISIVSLLIGIWIGGQYNLLLSLFHTDFEGSGDVSIDGTGAPHPEKTIVNTNSSISTDIDKQPSYLKWNDGPPKIKPNWSYSTPQYCTPKQRGCETCYQNWAKNKPSSMKNSTEKIIVHYHLQHNAGTNYFALVHNFTPCATRACWQSAKHCLVSYNQDVEADNIRNNYFQYGTQYVSYETMLPPRFPLPFVSESAREGLFFTTIMRNPMNRLITWLRKFGSVDKTIYKPGEPSTFFWNDYLEGAARGIYKRENLNVRWLSGALDAITEDHLNIAKCRLQLFDLVIADTLYDTAVNEVVCPLNNWRGRRFCNPNQSNEPKHKKQDPLNATDSHFIGAWIERLRPSFELYDYARILSYAQLKAHGVKDVPPVSEVPSYIATLSKYTNITLKVPEESRVNLTNIYKLHPPREFCEKMKRVWESNADEVPYVYGIGALS